MSTNKISREKTKLFKQVCMLSFMKFKVCLANITVLIRLYWIFTSNITNLYSSVKKNPPKLTANCLADLEKQLSSRNHLNGILQKSRQNNFFQYFHHIFKETIKPWLIKLAGGTVC